MSDLKHLRQLEKELGIKLKKTKLDGIGGIIASSNRCSYAIDWKLKVIGLNLSDMNLVEIPKVIYNMSNLRSLSIGNNKLTQIPKEIFELNELQSLDLAFNNIETLSGDIRKLRKLRVLLLHSNNIRILPLEILSFGIELNPFHGNWGVSQITLGNNPLEAPPKDTLLRGMGAVISYFERQIESSETIPSNILKSEKNEGNCSKCGAYVIATSEGLCPACRKPFSAKNMF